MNYKGNIYFTRSTEYKKLSIDNLIEKLQERIDDYYLQPARSLDGDQHGFAVCLLCFSLIEFIAQLCYDPELSSSSLFIAWVKEYLNLSKKESNALYESYRCGLVHNGSIKEGSYSYDDDEPGQKLLADGASFYFDTIVAAPPRDEEKVMTIDHDEKRTVHPARLLKCIEMALSKIYASFKVNPPLFYARFLRIFETNLRELNDDLRVQLESKIPPSNPTSVLIGKFAKKLTGLEKFMSNSLNFIAGNKHIRLISECEEPLDRGRAIVRECRSTFEVKRREVNF